MERQKQYRDEDVIRKLGQRIRDLRQSKGWSQETLAYEANLELSQINRIELGKINTSVSHLFLIAKVLQVKPAELIKFD